MSNVRILAPFNGWCDTLDAVPDPVFAGRMLGDGLAIDPTHGVVLAPCAGEIITLPASAHAVSEFSKRRVAFRRADGFQAAKLAVLNHEHSLFTKRTDLGWSRINDQCDLIG